MLWIISILAFAFVALGAFALGTVIDQRRSRARLLSERLSSLEKPAQRRADEELPLLRDELLSEIPAIDSLLRRSAQISSLQKLLEQADIKVRAGNFLLLSLGSALMVGAAVLLWERSALFGWLGAFVGFFLPYFYVSFQRNKRFARFEELFPQAIDTLVRAVRAGHAFTTALELISNEIPQPISGEFRKLFEEQKFGLPVREALVNLSDRIPLVDVKFFVTAVMLQRETGGNLAEILDNLSYVIRERFKIMRQVRVYTAQGRLTLMLLMGLPPTIVLIMLSLNPAFVRPLFADPLGHVLVAVGVTLQTIGYFVIRKIIQIKV